MKIGPVPDLQELPDRKYLFSRSYQSSDMKLEFYYLVFQSIYFILFVYTQNNVKKILLSYITTRKISAYFNTYFF